LFCRHCDVASNPGVAVKDVLGGCVVDEDRYGAIDEHTAGIKGIVPHGI
jgi:hypothetical protein